MDTTEDLSARVLVKHILNEEPLSATPLTRSAAAKLRSSPRRSSRVDRDDAGARTPQMMLRRSLKHKIQESVSSKMGSIKRRTAPSGPRQSLRATSMLLDDGETPRQTLKNILLAEPVKSPMFNERVQSQEPLPSPDSSIQSRRLSIEISGLELPDLTVGNIETTIKRLTRKRQHRSLNVTTFEKRLKVTKDVVDEAEESVDDPSSLSLSNSSLSLKTPFNEVKTERKALLRKVAPRTKISVEDFGAAVDRREMGNYNEPGQVFGESDFSEGLTLGLSKLSEPDISTDIVHCNTKLYAKSEAVASNYSIQGKATVMASQIQRDTTEQLIDHQQPTLIPTEQTSLLESQDGNQSLFKDLEEPVENVACSQSKREKTFENRTVDINAQTEALKEDDVQPSMEDSDEAATPAKIKEKSLADCTFDANGPTETPKVDHVQQSRQESDSQMEDKDGAESPTESKDEADTKTQNEAEEVEDVDEDEAESQNEELGIDQQKVYPPSLRLQEKESDAQSREDDGGVEESEDDAEEDEEEEDDEEEQVEANLEEGKDGEEDSQEEDEEMEDPKDEVEDAEIHLQEEDEQNTIESEREAPEGELTSPPQTAEAGLSNTTEPDKFDDMPASPTHLDDAEADDAEADDAEADDAEVDDAEEDDANQEDSFQENNPPDDVEQMEQSVEESEEEEEIPLKTPAFVKEKRNFFNLDRQSISFAPNKSQPGDAGPSAPGAKPKAQRKPRSKRSDSCLPKSYLMNVFRHFAKTKVSADVYPVLSDVMDKFFDRVAKDLEVYARHAGRSTIEVADCELLLKRQGHVNDKAPVEVLVEKYLRMDQRKLLIPCATSGNVVYPKK